MNEPHRGYISLCSFDSWDPMTDLAISYFPSALQSMALGAGYAQRVPLFVKSFPHPTRQAREILITPPKDGAWLPDAGGCVWLQHGVWAWDDNRDEPVALRSGYFRSDPRTGRPFEWYEDCWFPYVRQFAERVRRCGRDDWLIFAGAIPNEVQSLALLCATSCQIDNSCPALPALATRDPAAEFCICSTFLRLARAVRLSSSFQMFAVFQ
jgi:hypothetical protein